MKRWLRRSAETGMPLTEAAIIARVDAEYAATHARLASDPKYQALSGAARLEAAQTPSCYLARNHLSLYVEINTPPIGDTHA